MFWWLRILIDMPKAILAYRSEFKTAKKYERIFRKEGALRCIEEMEKIVPAELLIDLYYEMLEILKDNDSITEEYMVEYLEKGVELGFVFKKPAEVQEVGTPEWKRWEDGEE